MTSTPVFLGNGKNVRLFPVNPIHRNSPVVASEREAQQRLVVGFDTRLEKLGPDVAFVRVAREELHTLEFNVEALLRDDVAVFVGAGERKNLGVLK